MFLEEKERGIWRDFGEFRGFLDQKIEFFGLKKKNNLKLFDPRKGFCETKVTRLPIFGDRELYIS